MSQYEIWLSRPEGTRLALLDTVQSFEYAISLHEVGALAQTLPGTFDKTLLSIDNRIEVWRAPAGGALALERAFLVRRVQDVTDANGVRALHVYGVDGNDLLRRRIVAYAAGSAQAEMTDQADDMCRAIVVDNLGADADAARQIASAYLSIAPERSAGPSLTMGFARRNVLAVLQDIAQAADTAGTPIYWHVVEATPAQWEFRTYSGQPGIDHTYPDGQNPIMLSLELGNLAEPQLDEDYGGEITVAYAGGQGEEAGRNVQTAEDTARSGRSPFGRCEGWADARNEETDNGVLAAARRLLAEGRPRVRFAAKLAETAGSAYGARWRWGDRVTAVYLGRSYTALIRAVHVKVDGAGQETITARLEVTL